ncbi:hypothetical protein C8J56DRAFT_1081505 [Mycena floridula]|nr:hypothetical protein C8J56DRAFT_1081505 [Mycena floridula]
MDLAQSSLSSKSSARLTRRIAASQNSPGRPPDAVLTNYLQSIKGRLPKLVFLRADSGLSDEELDIFHHALRLHSMEFSDDSDLDLLRLPLAQLRTCILHSPTDLFSLLAECTQLVNATITLPLDHYPSELDVHIISNIQSLSLCVDGPDLHLLQALTLPCLTSFSLSLYNFRWEAEPKSQFPLGLWTSFIARTSCNFTTLSWDAIPIDVAIWISLLHSIPSLETLSLVDEHDEDFGEHLIRRFLQSATSWSNLVIFRSTP